MAAAAAAREAAVAAGLLDPSHLGITQTSNLFHSLSLIGIDGIRLNDFLLLLHFIVRPTQKMNSNLIPTRVKNPHRRHHPLLESKSKLFF